MHLHVFTAELFKEPTLHILKCRPAGILLVAVQSIPKMFFARAGTNVPLVTTATGATVVDIVDEGMFDF